MNTNSYAIEVKQITKSFAGKVAVNHLSLQIPKGEIFGFLGPNGSGKTTAIRMLCGLLTPDSGSGTCLGYDITHDTAKIKPQIGYMTQHFSLYNDLTIRENLNFMARLYNVPNRQEKVDETLKSLELSTRGNQLTGELSGGWKQRLALATCLLHNPKVLLLDEPTAGVDPKARFEFWEHLHTLAKTGVTVLVSTHYMDEAEKCDKLGYIAYGNLIATGVPQDLVKIYQQPNLEAVFIHLMKSARDNFQ